MSDLCHSKSMYCIMCEGTLLLLFYRMKISITLWEIQDSRGYRINLNQAVLLYFALIVSSLISFLLFHLDTQSQSLKLIRLLLYKTFFSCILKRSRPREVGKTCRDLYTSNPLYAIRTSHTTNTNTHRCTCRSCNHESTLSCRWWLIFCPQWNRIWHWGHKMVRMKGWHGVALRRAPLTTWGTPCSAACFTAGKNKDTGHP